MDVVTAKGKITVIFSDGQSCDATLIGRDGSYDLAVIRVERRKPAGAGRLQGCARG
jgi:S1-C subfamily serine protease